MGFVIASTTRVIRVVIVVGNSSQVPLITTSELPVLGDKTPHFPRGRGFAHLQWTLCVLCCCSLTEVKTCTSLEIRSGSWPSRRACRAVSWGIGLIRRCDEWTRGPQARGAAHVMSRGPAAPSVSCKIKAKSRAINSSSVPFRRPPFFILAVGARGCWPLYSCFSVV